MQGSINRWLSVWMLLLLALGASAQSQPVNCYDGRNLAAPNQYQNWNWEVTPSANDYCNTWTSRDSNGKLQAMGAPWNAPVSRPLIRISQASDFKKADGWELVRLDFGSRQLRSMPNFILYNKYQAKLRVFAWLTSTAFTSTIMTMEHIAGAQNGALVSAAVGLSQPLLKAPDKYLNSYVSDDLTTYICKYSGQTGWVMGEFTMLFDPNSADGRYYESSLLFKVYGIVNSTIELGGDFNFTTKPQEGYGFSGSVSKVIDDPAAKTKKFLAGGAKFLGQYDKLSDQVEAVSKKAKQISDGLANVKSGPLNGIKNTATSIAKATGEGSKLKGLLGIAGSLSGVFGLAGSVVGLLWPSDDKPTTVTPAPTVSSGSIKLTGTIETTTLIGSTVTEEPGTPHNFDGNSNGFRRASQPYYDCPMGLFNLRRTPQLAQRVYPRAKMYSGYRGQVPEELYTSYSVTQDLEPVFNQTSGMQVVSVKAAIVQKVGYSSLTGIVDNPVSPTRYNLLYAQVEAGNLEAVPFDTGPTSSPNDDTYLVQTPFVDIGCFKDMAFTAPTDSLARSPAFIRIIATLRRTNALATDAPYFFAQDYAFDALTPPAGSSSGGSGSLYLDSNDYLPYNSDFTVLFNPLDVTFTGTVFQQYGQFFAAPSSLLFDYSSSLQMDVVRNGGTAGYGGGSGGFHAGNTISFEGELSIPVGMDVYMTTDPYLNRTCSAPGLAAQAVGNCNPYNPWATTTVQAPPTASIARKVLPAARLSAAVIQLAPNPATQSTTVTLVSTEAEPAGISRVEVLNLSGQPVWQSASLSSATVTMEIPLRGLATGLYIVRVTTAGGSYVEKLVVQ